MSKQASPALIGGFFLGAVALIVAGIFIFGSGKFFTDTNPFVLYFDGDVNGLQVGAPVRLRGVQVGRVTGIKATFKTGDVQIRVPVFIEITQDSMEQIISGGEQRIAPHEGIQTLVEHGARAQLQMQSMVTGLLFIQFDFYPGVPAAQVHQDPDTGLPELPTVPTTFQEVSQTVRAALETLGKMPVEELFQKLLATVEGIERLVNSPEVTKTLLTLDATLANVQQLVRHLDSQLTPISADLRATLGDIRQVVRDELKGTLTDVRQVLRDDQNRVVSLAADFQATTATARGTLERIQAVLTTLDGAVAPGAPLRYELANTLEELSAAARSIRILVQLLEQQPDTIIRGKAELSPTRGR